MDIDPQHQAVKDAAAALKAERYWQRGPEDQEEYLRDVSDLTREVAFVLTQAGITWDDVASAMNSTGIVAQLLALDPRVRLEYALTTAVDSQIGKANPRVIE